MVRLQALGFGAFFANFFVLQRLIVSGDAAATTGNIAANGWLFRLGIAGLLVTTIGDAVAAWALYVVLRPVNRSLSLLAALFRLLYAAVFGVALNNLLTVLQLSGGRSCPSGCAAPPLRWFAAACAMGLRMRNV